LIAERGKKLVNEVSGAAVNFNYTEAGLARTNRGLREAGDCFLNTVNGEL